MTISNESVILQLKGWTVPTYHSGRQCYVAFSAFDPVSGKMKRKKVMLDFIPDKKLRRLRAEEIMKRLTQQLMEGWNPWMEQQHAKDLATLKEVAEKYRKFLYKMMPSDSMREESVKSYLSYLNILKEWCAGDGDAPRVTYIIQLDRVRVGEFLDYVFVERGNGVRTRNNYLAWLRSFSKWLLQRGYVREDPTAGHELLSMRRRAAGKNREVIPDRELVRLREFLEKENRYYLLAVYLTYYAMIRPKELAYIKVGDVVAGDGTRLVVHGWKQAKNHKDGSPTLPRKVVALMEELGVLEYPKGYYLFSDRFRPGRKFRDGKAFRDYWLAKVRKGLGWPAKWKFYSLKDTGITNMLRSSIDVLSVRDQARHSDVSITNMYTPSAGLKDAVPEVTEYDGLL